MTSNSEPTPAPRNIPLRIGAPTLSNDVWPCPEDLLGRDKEIENLSPVLLQAEAPLVIAIDSPWGHGKTTFIRLWRHYLTKNNKVSLLLNAWESDFADDPLLPMLAEFEDWLSKPQTKSEPSRAWAEAKKHVPAIVKATAIAGVKILTFGALDVAREIEAVAADLAGNAVGGLVENYTQKRAALTEFKIRLGGALDALPNDQRNLIIFVDELDRCKPLYAIELLERIKHLFDLERIVFVLAINKDQLIKSFEGVYGPRFDGDVYLRRILDLDYRLRTPAHDQYVRSKLAQEDLRCYFQSRNCGLDDQDSLVPMLAWLSHRFDYSLRDIDQYVTRLRLIVRSIPANQRLDIEFLAALIVLRQSDHKLYFEYSRNPRVVNEVIEHLMGKPSDIAALPEFFPYVAAQLIAGGERWGTESYWSEVPGYWKEILGRLEPRTAGHGSVNELVEILESPSRLRGSVGEVIRTLAFKRIELVSKINLT